MAETDDDAIAGRFLPLPAALAYLEKHADAPAYAELLLQRGSAEGLIPYREHETEVHFPDRGNPRVPDRVFVPLPPPDGVEFWRIAPFGDSSRLKFDRKRSEVTRIDHAAQNLDGTWCEHRIVCKRGVRFSEGGLKRILQSEGLLPSAAAPAPPGSSGQPQKKETAASWVPKAAILHPRQEGWTASRWAQHLTLHAPGGAEDGWDQRTILNELSKQGFTKKPVS